MDDVIISAEPKDVYFKPKCPVKVGDRFYMNNYEVKIGRHGPIYNEVIKVIESREPGVYYIEVVRPQCTAGKNVTYSSVFFKNPDVVIERKGIDF